MKTEGGQNWYQKNRKDKLSCRRDITFKISIIWIRSRTYVGTYVVLRRLCELVPAEGVPVLERPLHPRDVAVRRGDGLSGRAGRVAGALQRHQVQSVFPIAKSVCSK